MLSRCVVTFIVSCYVWFRRLLHIQLGSWTSAFEKHQHSTVFSSSDTNISGLSHLEKWLLFKFILAFLSTALIKDSSVNSYIRHSFYTPVSRVILVLIRTFFIRCTQPCDSSVNACIRYTPVFSVILVFVIVGYIRTFVIHPLYLVFGITAFNEHLVPSWFANCVHFRRN